MCNIPRAYKPYDATSLYNSIAHWRATLSTDNYLSLW
jgi:hypothetical protein